jgi:hypothetical protein
VPTTDPFNFRREKTYAVLCLLLILGFLAYTNQRYIFWDETERKIVDVLPKDPQQIPPIYHPTFVSVEESYLGRDDMVIGVVKDTEAKAYPVMILERHEVVDDTIGGMPIVVSYCPLTGSPVVFERQENVTYGVSGKLLKNNLVLYDNKTQSLWSQIMMRAVSGSLKGTALKILPNHLMAWSAWVRLFPTTVLLAIPSTLGQTEDSAMNYSEYRESPAPGVFPLENINEALRFKEYVLGVQTDASRKAYPFRVLQNHSVLNDHIGGEAVVLTFYEGSGQAFKRTDRSFHFYSDGYMKDELGYMWNIVTGEQANGTVKLEPLVYVPMYWFAWYDFHPDTQIYALSMIIVEALKKSKA